MVPLHPTELAFIRLARQIGAMAQQGSALYRQAQDALQLEYLITPERMTTSAGSLRSLATLDELAALHEQHKTLFAKFTTAAMAQMADAIAVMPEETARRYRDGVLGGMNDRLAAQARFYASRDEWIAAARALFTMLEDARDDIVVHGNEIVFDDDASVGRFNGLLETLERIHQSEVAVARELMARVTAAHALLDAVERGAGR